MRGDVSQEKDMSTDEKAKKVEKRVKERRGYLIIKLADELVILCCVELVINNLSTLTAYEAGRMIGGTIDHH